MGTLIIVLFHVVAIVDAQRKKFSCTAGNFSVGETASITCDFNKDVSKEHYSYYVGWYAHDSKDKVKGAEALACFRTLSEELVCNVAQGFRFNDIITDRLVLEIPNVTQRFAGQYSCQYVPPDGRRIKTCSLNVTVVKKAKSLSTGDTQLTPTSTTMDTDRRFHSSIENESTRGSSKTQEEKYHMVLILLVWVLVVIVIAVAVAVVLILVLKRKRPRNRYRDERGDEESGMTMLPFDNWWKDLPKPVRKSLEKARLTSQDTLVEATEEDIKCLKLKPGDRINLKQKLKRLRRGTGELGQLATKGEPVQETETPTKTARKSEGPCGSSTKPLDKNHQELQASSGSLSRKCVQTPEESSYKQEKQSLQDEREEAEKEEKEKEEEEKSEKGGKKEVSRL